MADVVIYPCSDYSQTMLVKGVQFLMDSCDSFTSIVSMTLGRHTILQMPMKQP